jgi:hypothetical protein
MPRKYTRRNLSPEHPIPGAPPVEQGAPPAAEPMAPFAPKLTAMEEYGLWLKQNQHVTQALPPEPPQPRKAPNVPRPRY